MKISDVYSRYKIPPNLQRHMIRVAAVGAYIVDHWRDKNTLDRDSIIQALLLHDMGNIIKFDFSLPALMGEEAKNIEYWKQVKLEFIQKYQNEHTATSEIAHELRLNQEAMSLLNSVGSTKLHLACDSEDWNKKVVCYSDFRIDPHGVVTVNKRFDDIVDRYKGRTHDLSNIESTEKRRNYCLTLEKQLAPRVTFNMNDLTDKDIESYTADLFHYEIS